MSIHLNKELKEKIIALKLYKLMLISRMFWVQNSTKYLSKFSVKFP